MVPKRILKSKFHRVRHWERSVWPVREHRKLARTPLEAFFNRPPFEIGATFAVTFFEDLRLVLQP
jgi:hypothetical protein